ncbi:GtrA family protein [Streptomyces sp. XM83C]|jgi:putative flippase GtrA|uniref:GtrA family protein n=1 Tax=unclassified Streptomyces TaxID=2593676 RepID=UPI001FF7F5A7|nr:GtrA family protein [Streptomyces sp. XM83C]MCK1819137.1 GtrA family protein [Streptomyces sp. XM83C]
MGHGSSGLKRLTQEIAKFGAVGAFGMVVNFAVSNALWHLTSLQAVRANVIATVVAIGCNYIGFRYFTYRERDKTDRTRELVLFLAFSAIGLVIENGILYAAIYGFGWSGGLERNVFKFLGIGVATLFRFWSYRTWVFRALPVHEPRAGESVVARDVASEGAAASDGPVLAPAPQPRPRQRV